MNDQPPNDEEIRQMLNKLHDELAHAETFDAKQRTMMRHLMNDIRELLDRPDQENSTSLQSSKSLMDRLNASMEVLELSHPTLTAMIEKAVETLSVAGL